MKVKSIVVEDFCNYKLPSMFIVSSVCDWKCCLEQHLDIGVCQNSAISAYATKDIDDNVIYNQFADSQIAKAVVVGGLEPFLQFEELKALIKCFREHGEFCDFIIYTGYYPEEIQYEVEALKQFKNIVIKFGRYIPNSTPVFDWVLGVTLASENQFARRIS